MQRQSLSKKTTQKLTKPTTKAPQRKSLRKITTTKPKIAKQQLSLSTSSLNFTMPSFSSLTSLPSLGMSSPLTTSQRFMAKGGDKGGKNGKNDKKSASSSATPAADGGFNSTPFIEKMSSFVEAYSTELSNVKVGRATPEMLHDILVENAGKKVPLKAISQVYVKPPAALIVSLHEPSDSLDKAVCNAISGAGMDLNPFTEEVHGVPSIIVPFPKPTKELRDSLIKITKSKAEETKINIRNQRKLWNDAIKKAGLPKDEAYRSEQDCQKQTDKHCDTVSDLASKKEKEINAV